jgi:hypothetical protein
MVQTDVLKIVIAESHFSGKEPPDKIAQDLGIATDLVKDTFGRMLQEVGVSAANQFGRAFGNLNLDAAKTNDEARLMTGQR